LSSDPQELYENSEYVRGAEYVEKSKGNPYVRGTDIEHLTINIDNLVYISDEEQYH